MPHRWDMGDSHGYRSGPNVIETYEPFEAPLLGSMLLSRPVKRPDAQATPSEHPPPSTLTLWFAFAALAAKNLPASKKGGGQVRPPHVQIFSKVFFSDSNSATVSWRAAHSPVHSGAGCSDRPHSSSSPNPDHPRYSAQNKRQKVLQFLQII